MLHYNVQRPNQALSCGNQAPRTAFPHLPALPALPELVDPDAWLDAFDGVHLERKVDRRGTVSLDLKRYYVSVHLAGQHVVLHLDAKARCVQVLHEQQLIKSLPIKGLVGHLLSFEQFLAHMALQARDPSTPPFPARASSPHSCCSFPLARPGYDVLALPGYDVSHPYRRDECCPYSRVRSPCKPITRTRN